MFPKIKNNNKTICNCKETVKPQLIAEAGCSNDLAAVSVLPDHWLPRHCTPTLTKYLKQREIAHERVLEELLQDAKQVNIKIDEEVRAISENLLSHIQQNQKDIHCTIKKSEPEEGVLSVEARNEVLKEISILFTQRTQDLAKFKQEALGLERQRAEGIRNVLKTYFHRLIGVGHKTPKDLLHDFDERIYEINQQLLSNSRAYIELEDKLRVQLDENKVHARSLLNQLCIKQTREVVRGQSALPWSHKNRLHMRSDSADNKKKQSIDSTRELMFDIEEFKQCVSQLVEAYRGAILKIFTGFSGQLEDLHKNIGFKNLEDDKSNTSSTIVNNLEHMIERALRRFSNSRVQLKSSIYKDLEDMTRTDVLNMQKTLSNLGKCFRETYIILYEASHLWDEHILRSALVQKLTTAAIEDLQTITHDAMELSNEINFNIVLEQLRCAPDIDKVQQNFDVAKSLLDRVGEIYLQHSAAEIVKLEEYMNLTEIMTNVLLSECHCFLENHPKSIIAPSGSLTSPAGAESPKAKSAYSLRAPLPRAILQTQVQEVALSNWKNGFLESFLYNLPAVSEELNHQARKWVDEKKLQLNMRYSLKLMSHGIRTERIKAAREVRLSELRFHELRLNSHLEAIFNLIDNLPQEASLFLSIDAPTLYPICKWVKRMETNIDNLLTCVPLDPEIKRLKMSSYAPRLIRHRQHFEESLDAAIEKYKKNIEYLIQEARISNLRFLSHVKLFIEGGKYAAAEAAKTCATLVKAADSLEPCFHRTMDVLHHRRSQLLALADQQILPIQRIVEESYKMGGKNELDKKRAPTNKKK